MEQERIFNEVKARTADLLSSLSLQELLALQTLVERRKNQVEREEEHLLAVEEFRQLKPLIEARAKEIMAIDTKMDINFARTIACQEMQFKHIKVITASMFNH